MKSTYRFLVFFTMPVLDFFIITCSGLLSYGLYRILGIGQKAVYPFPSVFQVCLAVSLIAIFILYAIGAYNRESGLLNVQEIKNTIKGMTVSFLICALAMVFLQYQIPRYVMVLFYFLSIVLLVTAKAFLYHILPQSRRIQGLNRRILIYGAGELGLSLFRSIAMSPKLGVFPVGFVDDDPCLAGNTFRSSSFTNSRVSITVLGTGSDVHRLVKDHQVDEVCVAISNIESGTFIEILEKLRKMGVATSFVPNLYEAFVHKVTIDKVGQIPLVREANTQPPRLRKITKKLMDITVSLLLLITLAPVFLAIAAAVRRDSGGPVFFTHQRVGLKGRLFNIIKFRTMRADANPYEINPTDVLDPRITRVGRFLRKTSLDELPQLFNVLKGEMSLVGPRPEMPFIADTYTERHRERLAVKPGITGLWQLSGDREKPIHENMDYDLYYIRNESLFLDIAVLIETALFAFRGI